MKKLGILSSGQSTSTSYDPVTVSEEPICRLSVTS